MWRQVGYRKWLWQVSHRAPFPLDKILAHPLLHTDRKYVLDFKHIVTAVTADAIAVAARTAALVAAALAAAALRICQRCGLTGGHATLSLASASATPTPTPTPTATATATPTTTAATAPCTACCWICAIATCPAVRYCLANGPSLAENLLLNVASIASSLRRSGRSKISVSKLRCSSLNTVRTSGGRIAQPLGTSSGGGRITLSVTSTRAPAPMPSFTCTASGAHVTKRIDAA
eukprot:664517-Prymnesium_polylepis.1